MLPAMSPVAAMAFGTFCTEDAYAAGNGSRRAGDVHVPSVLSQYTAVDGVTKLPAMTVTPAVGTAETAYARPPAEGMSDGGTRCAPAVGHAPAERVHTPAYGAPVEPS